MRRGTKPLARFADAYGLFPDVVVRYLKMFEVQVESGSFVKREYVQLNEPASNGATYHLHVIMFALPREDWRFDAMIDLLGKKPWTEIEEREEGRLLGYEDWQNDVWIARRFHP